MTDISEAQTFEYFINGVRKAKSAARQLAALNETHEWTKIRSMLGQIEKNAQHLYTSSPQTRLETLSLAGKIQSDAVH